MKNVATEHTLGFHTKQDENGKWEAWMHARQIVSAEHETEAAAIGGLMLICMRLGREGSVNPRSPDNHGAGVIQHVMEVLSEHMQMELRNRYDYRRLEQEEAQTKCKDENGNPKPMPDYESLSNIIQTRSERIAALSTAIAAVARVKLN